MEDRLEGSILHEVVEGLEDTLREDSVGCQHCSSASSQVVRQNGNSLLVERILDDVEDSRRGRKVRVPMGMLEGHMVLADNLDNLEEDSMP